MLELETKMSVKSDLESEQLKLPGYARRETFAV